MNDQETRFQWKTILIVALVLCVYVSALCCAVEPDAAHISRTHSLRGNILQCTEIENAQIWTGISKPIEFKMIIFYYVVLRCMCVCPVPYVHCVCVRVCIHPLLLCDDGAILNHALLLFSQFHSILDVCNACVLLKNMRTTHKVHSIWNNREKQKTRRFTQFYNVLLLHFVLCSRNSWNSMSVKTHLTSKPEYRERETSASQTKSNRRATDKEQNA